MEFQVRNVPITTFTIESIRTLEKHIAPLIFAIINSTVAKIIYEDMADVPKSLYRRYLEVSEATFQALLKNHSAGDVQYYKPILNFSSPHKGFEGCLPFHLLQHLGKVYIMHKLI